jgi:two-component system sensor histidine kinase HydH
MSAAVAHEVRNPLASMKGAVELLNGKARNGDASSEKLLALLSGEIQRLERVVDGFLDYARPAAAKLAPERLQEVARRTIDLLSKDPDLGGVTINLEVKSDLPPIALDAEQIRQVLLNLVRNAAQAMAGAGRVTIEIGREGGEAVLRVRDSGPGFGAAVLRRAFDPFFTTRSRGSGLGLAIARRIVEGHDGRILLGNPPSGGAEVVIVLPISEAEAES